MSDRILMLHQGALGDVVLSFPALEALKREREASVELLCRNSVGKVALALNVVDHCFDVDGARFCRLFGTLADPSLTDFFKRYDTVVLVGFSPETQYHMARNFHQNTVRITPRPPAEQEMHVARHVILALRESGVLEMGRNTRRDDRLPRVDFHRPGQGVGRRNVVLVHPGAGSRRKRWRAQRFIDVATRLQRCGKEVAFLVGPAERDLLPALEMAKRDGRFCVYQEEGLGHVIHLLRRSVVFVGCDSGISHLAAYMGVPTVAVFGPTSPKRWAPLGECVAILRGEEACSPCFEIEAANCEDPLCLSHVTVEMVLEAINGLIVCGP